MINRLTHDGDYKQHLAWSPDGKKFLFTRLHRGKMGLWTMNADGTELKRLLSVDTPHFDGHWSPDSKRILYVYDVLQGTDGKLNSVASMTAMSASAPILVPQAATAPDLSGAIACSIDNPECEACQ